MSISGRISAPSGATLPATGITVHVSPASNVWNEVTSTTASSTGKYTLSGLPAGAYVLHIEVDPGSGLLDEWYNDKSDPYSADRVQLTAGVNKTGVNVTLAKAASISGVVSVPAGTPGGASSVFVSAYDASQSWVGSTSVESDGTYTIDSLPAGATVLHYTATSESGLLDEWFDDERAFASADAIVLAEGEKHTGANAALVKGAAITGRVSVPSGVTIADGTIQVVAVGPGHEWVKSAYVAADGTYRLAGLDAGDYRVQFDADSTTGLLDEWYDDATEFRTAKVVSVAAGATRTGVNVALARGASISGRITVPAGASPSAVSVEVLDATQTTVGSADVASDGTYIVRGLPSGSLRVFFSAMSPSPVQSEWWNDKADFASATAIVLTAGQARTGVDATLARGASISGKVTAPAGYSVAGGYVEVHTSEYESSVSGYIGADGTFSVTGLPAGTYRLKFQPPWNSALLPEWYDDASKYGDASPVTLTSGQSLSGVNAAFAVGGTITGKVTLPAGTPRSSEDAPLRVSATLDSVGGGGFFSTSVASDGSYSLRGLPAGAYRVRFESPDQWSLIDEYYDDATAYSEATLVPVKSGQTVSGINATLAAGGSISGRVTLPSGVKVDSMQYDVTAYGPQMTYVASVGLNADGTYALRGLPAGTYRLEFSTPLDSGVLSEWYTDKSTFWSADSVTLAAGQSLSNVDAVLDRGGIVKGSVRDAAGAGVPNARVTLYARSDSGWQWQNDVSTDGAGAYVFTGLGPATYTLAFTPPSGSPLLPEWWNDSPDSTTATGFTLTAGQVRGSLLATLTTGGTVRGTVRATDGSPLPDAEVHVRNRAGADLGSTRTDASGTYSVGGLPAGDVAVGVLTAAGLTYANGAAALVSATFASVALAHTTTVDIALGGRSITGVVTAADTGAAIAGGTVVLYSSTGAIGAQATIGKTGAYALRNVPRGSYTVLIRPAAETYAPTWAEGASSAADADYFSMSTSSLKKNFTVLRAGSITGTAKSSLLSGLDVRLWQSTGGTWTSVDSRWSSGGEPFSFSSLAPGVYAVTASFDGSSDPETVPRITVVAGATVDIGTVTDVPVATAGSLGGNVTGISRASDVRVVATSSGGRQYYASVQRTMAKTFVYSFPALPSGSYTVRVASPTAPLAWFGGSDAASARPVAVTAGSATTADVTITPGKASLGGSITAPDGSPVSAAYVNVSELDSAGHYLDGNHVVTGSDGRYAFPSMLVPGHTYRVTVSWSERAVSALVTARAGSQTRNLAFEAPARLKGTVVDATTGAPVAGAPVRAVRDGSGAINEGYPVVTDSRGRYDIPNVPSGTYRIQIGSWGEGITPPNGTGAYAPEWITDAVTSSAAQPVVVKAGAVVTAPATKLSSGGVLTGRVRATPTAGGSVWMTDAVVTVKTVDGATVLSGGPVPSGAPGAFSFVLPPGSYRLCAAVPDWIPGHARHAETCNSSTVTVTAGATAPATTVTLTERKG